MSPLADATRPIGEDPTSAGTVPLEAVLVLSPSVALRPEPFGALAYHFGNRRLTFLKRPELVSLVSGFDGSRTLREILTACNVPSPQWPAFQAALERLMESDMVHPREGEPQ